MLFNSLEFVLFFAALYALYLLLPRRAQNILLLVGSYVFYASWDWRFLGLIAFVTVVDYSLARAIDSTEDDRRRGRLLAASLAANLGLLGFFKYFNFFEEGAFRLLHMVGLREEPWQIHIALPIGISFFIFKTMSYVFDVHGRQMRAERNLLNYAVHVAFFPYLLSGPIDRAVSFLPQLAGQRTVDGARLKAGFWLIAWGLFKKMVVADNLVGVANTIMHRGDANLPALHALVGIYAYAVQLYCDFSGYTDIARGLVTLLGFDAPPNFRNPYFAHNPMEFWNRWHISLSRWIQDYVYFPLAASIMRRSPNRWIQYTAHPVTMAAIGLWHGATLNYLAYGLYWGIAIAIAYEIRRAISASRRKRGIRPAKVQADAWTLSRVLKVVGMFHLVCGAFILFAPSTPAETGCLLRSLFAGHAIRGAAVTPFINDLFLLVLLWLPVFIIEIAQERSADEFVVLKFQPVPLVATLAIMGIMFLGIGSTGGEAFVYVQF